MRLLPRAPMVLVAALVLVVPVFETVSAQSGPSPNIVISEFRFRGAGAADEFIELFNASSDDVNVGLWELWGADTSAGDVRRAQIPDNTIVKSGCSYLLAASGFFGPRDLGYAPSFPDLASFALKLPDNGAIVDQVGVGATSFYGEGTRLPQLINAITGPPSYERRPGGAQGHADTNNNQADFKVNPSPTPTTSSMQSSCLVVLTVYVPHEIQGAGATSPKAGNTVTVRGVVTARTSDGFFIQTEPGREDADPNTSEGLFVATSAATEAGDVVQVKGVVQEHADGNATVTRLSSTMPITILSQGSTLPAPVVLTAADLTPSGPADALERFEGMRVNASLLSVSGSRGDGSFYAVLGDARPFREPGIEVGSPALPCAISTCNFATFDGNPERLRVDADAVIGTTAGRISSLVTLDNVVGPLHYALNAYTVLPEVSLPALAIEGLPLPAAGAGQYSVGSLNLGDASLPAETRRAKAAQMMRDKLGEPDVVAVQNADPSLLGDLAADLGGYTAVADRFLVKSERVTVVSTAVLGDTPLFDRPSLMMRVVIGGGALVLPQHLTVIANELRSLADVGRNDLDGEAARAQRQGQAELIAEAIRDRQLNAPSEPIISLGNYNAFEFNDGYVDVVGTIAGAPAPVDEVVLASPDRVVFDLENLIGTLPADQRYSTVVNGNAQALDHTLVSPELMAQLAGFGFVRINADFPESSQADATSPERLSDRDPSVAYFTFPPDLSAPVFDPAPQDVETEATSAAGAVVSYDSPNATDNLDQEVAVSCEPVSGSVFPLGHTGVRCSAEDAAGNAAEVWFTVTVQDTTAPSLTVAESAIAEATGPEGAVVQYHAPIAIDTVDGAVPAGCTPESGSVFPLGNRRVDCAAQDAAGNLAAAWFVVTVQDTTAPVLLVPANIRDRADSAAGRIVEYSVSASDAVTAVPTITCSPVSGSMFALGTTTVNCQASDDAGNSSAASSFTVTIGEPVLGRMHGAGQFGAGGRRITFMFEVRESSNYVERGQLMLLVKDQGRPGRLEVASVSDVRLSDVDASVTFTAYGSWNGKTGYRFEVAAHDEGEPGVGVDTLQVVVKAPNGDVVEQLSGVLIAGNIQGR